MRIEYAKALAFVVRERSGGGGWPPRDVEKVRLWMSVRLIAALFNKSHREVAADLIEFDIWQGNTHEQKAKDEVHA